LTTAPSFEGPISALNFPVPASQTASTPSDATITIFNTKVKLASNAKYSTPSREGLTYKEIYDCNLKPIPGRGTGFAGGTGILTGETTGVPNTTATDVFVEPAEHVLIGKISELPGVNGGSKFKIEDTEVILMPKDDTIAGGSFPANALTWLETNPCIPGIGIRNEFGFDLPVSALERGSDAVAEGWYSSTKNIFYAFLIDGVGLPDVNSVPRQVSITRAQCRTRATNRTFTQEWEVRGGVANGLGQFRRQIGVTAV